MLLAAMSQYFFGITIFVTSLFLILLVLVQRGRGGGLTGALGGPGGQSAFGTKAGDLFTRITIGVAAFWIFLCAAAVYFTKSSALPTTGLKTDAGIGAASDPDADPSDTPATTSSIDLSPPAAADSINAEVNPADLGSGISAEADFQKTPE